MYKLQNAEEINYALAALPKAIERPVFIGEKGEDNSQLMKYEKDFKAIEVDGKIVSMPTKYYKLVQHEQAFRPFPEALTLRGISNFKFSLLANHKRAWMNIFVGEGADTIRFGFRVTNSFDRSTSITAGLKSFFVKNRVVELVGYRQVCSNGMIVRVNLDQAEFVREEEKLEIMDLLGKQMKIRHNSLAEAKLEELQYTVEAFLLMKNPLQRIVDKAQSINLYKEQAEELIRKYVGKRRMDKVMEQYDCEEQTLWGLYNSLTFIASRNYIEKSDRVTKFNSLVEKAATMLEQELTVPSF